MHTLVVYTNMIQHISQPFVVGTLCLDCRMLRVSGTARRKSVLAAPNPTCANVVAASSSFGPHTNLH